MTTTTREARTTGRKGRANSLFVWGTALLVTLGAAGCDEGSPTLPEGAAVFVLAVDGEEFRAAVTDPAAVEALEDRLADGEVGVVSGRLRAGDGGFNEPWSWHWEPSSVHVADMAMEVCDGWPAFVEEELEYWLGTVKQFCPWGAEVVRRER